MATAVEEFQDQVLLLEGRIGESVGGLDDRGRPKQEVWVDLIREGFGNARDQHYYPATSLEAAQKLFLGAKMYVNHLDPEAQKRLNGYPRDIQQLAGRIREVKMARNSDGVPALRGRVSISAPWLWQMVEHDPDLIGVSINARGSSRPGMMEGRSAKIVEGINRVVSVDWVTEAGAGGKVVSLVEAQLRNQGRGDELDMGIEQLTEEDEHSKELLDDEVEEGRARAHARRHVEYPASDHVDPGLVDPHVAMDDEDGQSRHGDMRDIGLHHEDHLDTEGGPDWEPVHGGHITKPEHDAFGRGRRGRGRHMEAAVDALDELEEGDEYDELDLEDYEEGDFEEGDDEDFEEAHYVSYRHHRTGARHRRYAAGPAEAKSLARQLHHAGHGEIHIGSHRKHGGSRHRLGGPITRRLTGRRHHRAVEGEVEPLEEGADFEEAGGRHHHHRTMARRHHKHARHLRARGEHAKAKRHEERARHHEHMAHRMREAEFEPDLDDFEEYEQDDLEEADVRHHHRRRAKHHRHQAMMHKRAGNHERARHHLRLAKKHESMLHEADFASFEEAGYDEGDGEDFLEAEIDEDPEDVEPTYSDEQFEARAREIARENLREAVARALDSQAAEYDAVIETLNADHAKELGQRDQREKIATIIEKSGLPGRSQESLKADLFDAYFEAEISEDGEELKSAADVLQEAVSAKVSERAQELSVFTEARVTGAGPTAGSAQHNTSGETAGGPAPKKAPADAKVKQKLGLT